MSLLPPAPKVGEAPESEELATLRSNLRGIRGNSPTGRLVNGGFNLWIDDGRGNPVFNEAEFEHAMQVLDAALGGTAFLVWDDILVHGGLEWQ